MMERYKWQIRGIIVVLLVVNVACWVWVHHRLASAAPPTVRVISTLPENDADDADRFTLVFDRAVVSEAGVGRVEPASAFEVTPPWPGTWQWSSRETLEYRLEKPLPRGHIFTVSATGAFPRRTGMVLDGETTFQFRTSALDLTSCSLTSYGGQSVTFELRFNQPVDPGELERQLRVYDGKRLPRAVADADNAPGEPVAPETGQLVQLQQVQCLTKIPGKTLIVRTSTPRTRHLTLLLGKDLVGHEAQLPLGRDVVRTLSFSGGLRIERAWAPRPQLEETLRLRVRLSHKLKSGQKLPGLTVTPTVDKLHHHTSDRELVLAGRFKPGRSYIVTVPQTLVSQDGQTLGEDKRVTVLIPERRTRLVIPHWSGVLSPHGNLLLSMKVVNVEAIKLTAWRVHENNVVHYLAGGSRNSTSRTVVSRTIKLSVPRNEPRTVAMELGKLFKSPRGIYTVHAQATNRRWIYDSSVVCITDLAITAKREHSGAVVWVTSLRTGQPVEGVTVKAFTYNNQSIAGSQTDAQGIARLRFPVGHPDGKPWVITARKDADLSYLRTDENRWVIDEVNQSGRPYPNAYEVMLYTERGVYRPGDVVHLTGIIRDRDGDVPPAFPLAVQVTRPDGRLVADMMIKPENNRQGVFHADFPTREDGQTGGYRFQVRVPGAKEVLGETQTLVEAFVPVRMQVTAEPTAKRFGPDDTPKVKLSGRYLWDQPAAEVDAVVEGTLRAVAYRSTSHRDYRFHAPSHRKPIYLSEVKGKLDANGKAELDVKLPTLPADAGVYVMQLAATVTEPGGRSVSANTSAVLDRSDRHIGLRLAKGQLTEVGKPVRIDWVALTGADEPSEPGAMSMTLVRVEYDSVLKKINRRWVWQSVERIENISAEAIAPTPGSKGRLAVTCTEPGRYRVVLTDAKTRRGAQLDFYAWAEGAAKQSVPMNRPERLEIVLDRETYRPGEVAKVLVRSPISGMLFLTLETDEVVASHVVKIAQNTAELELTLPEDLRGGAFVAGTVVRAVDPTRKSWLPHRAMGLARVLIDHASSEVPVVIRAPKKVEPGETIQVTVDASSGVDPERPAVVHLWAVDEGILLPTAYRVPDPKTFFLSARRGGVASSDLFYRLLPDYERPAGMTRIGAGGGPNVKEREYYELRRNPVPSRRREPAVVWRKVVPVDADGRVVAAMTLPDLTGQLRLMAVVVDGDRYGHTRHDMTLTAPLVVESTWPRFAAPGDVFEVPVKLFNTTDAELTVRVKTSLTGPVEMLPGAELERIAVAPGKPVTRFLKVKASRLGPVEVRIDATSTDAGGKTLACHSTASFPVRPATALHGEVKLVVVKAGDDVEIAIPDTLVPGTARMTLELSAMPGVQLGPALERVVGYPYGCVEQTTSKLYALLYAADILGSDRIDAISDMIQAGIIRLWSMQTRSGGLSYWPGGEYANLWCTAYASRCLLEAASAGHKTDPRFLKELVKYMESKLRVTDYNPPDVNVKALICRVLAVFGEPPTGWMSRLAERKNELDLAGQCHLAAAFYAAGRKDRALKLLPAETPAVIPTTTSEMRLTSRVRQEAVWLSVLLEIDPKNPKVAALATRLEKARTNGLWGSTLNNAAAVAALSRYQATRTQNEPRFTGEVHAPGAKPVTFDHTKPLSHRLTKLTGPVTISTDGAGMVYVSASVEGLAKKGVLEPYNRTLTVTRRWLDRAGKPVDPAKLKVGDMVRVEVTITSSRNDVHNVAIVDALPAACEVENPRLVTSSYLGHPAGNEPDHVEFLDDRVVLFCRAGKWKQTFRYALRVTTAGEFDLPPIQASCMYDPSIASLGKSGRVSVRK